LDELCVARYVLRARAEARREALEGAALHLTRLSDGLHDGPFQDGVAMAAEEIRALAAEVKVDGE